MPFRVPLRPLVFSALLASAAVAVAWTTPGTSVELQAPAAGASRGADDLEEVMHGMDKAFEGVVAALEKKDAPAALEFMSKIQQTCITAKTMTPPKLRTVEEKDKPAFVAGYRKQLMMLLKASADLEIALVDGDLEAAQKVVDEMDELKKVGHDAYKKMPRKKKE